MLHTEGSTNAEAGLNLGYQLANQLYRADAINRVILCSDGVANVGATTADQLLHTIRSYADAGISLTTLGFGMGDYNDNLMEQLADKGDGNYGYIDNDVEARRLLVEGLTTTLQTIAMNAKVQVDFNSEVVGYYRLIGYENRAVADGDFRNNAVDAGEIGAGHTVTALYAVIFKPGAEGRIATMNLRWEDPTTHQVQEINGDFNTSNMARSFDDASPRYQLDVVVAQFAELLRHSPYAQETNLNDLKVRADRLSAQLDDTDVAEFARLVGQAAQTSGW
jgi:Ca-activated chloride channel family protein